MANKLISKITLNGVVYDLKDANARARLTSLEGVVRGGIQIEVVNTQNSIMQRQEQFEAQARERAKNKLRDRLLQNYRYYGSVERNPKQAWSLIERDAFYDLYNDYTDLGGNGLIHTEVEPKMATLRVIPMENKEELDELTKSRGS